jgi:energy-coupling factor transporter ATP-binding protein EcfA2
MFFKNLRLDNWRQFEKIDLELHDHLTVITGANGAGKTSLLNIFAEHFGWQSPYLATPTRVEKGYEYLVGVFGRLLAAWRTESGDVTMGSISYSNGETTTLTVPRATSIQYQLNLPRRQVVDGVHISSHRDLPRYQTVRSIPATSPQLADAYDSYNNLLLQRFQGSYGEFSPTYRLKESLMAMATFGAGNEYVQPNPTLLKAYTEFVALLRKVIPPSIGFLNLSMRPPEVVIVTKSGEFVLDAASGGILALIDLVFRIHMYSLTRESFVVTIDEPENHLHPSMQRSLLPSLLNAFPRCQFIIATHSPLMISAVKDSAVYALKFIDREGKPLKGEPTDTALKRVVTSLELDTINKAGTAAAILRDVLGVEATIPEWVESDLANLIAQLRDKPITKELLDSLREELTRLGFSQLYPTTVARLVTRSD